MKQLQILHTDIPVGLKQPIRILQLTDCHLCMADDIDRAEDPDKPEHAQSRGRAFDGGEPGSTERLYREALAYADREQLLIVCTGDVVDFQSHAGFAYVDRTLGCRDCFYVAGNHDFCHFVGRAKEDDAYKWEKMKIAAPHFRQNLYFDSRLLGNAETGYVNLVGLDNTYYRMTDGQTDLLRAEAAKGYPIVLFMHVPLYTEALREIEMAKSPCAYTVAAPRELVNTYPEDRKLQQMPDEATLRCVEYIKSEPLIRALVVGHTHYNHEGPLENGVMQYVTHGSFSGYVREICFC